MSDESLRPRLLFARQELSSALDCLSVDTKGAAIGNIIRASKRIESAMEALVADEETSEEKIMSDLTKCARAFVDTLDEMGRGYHAHTSWRDAPLQRCIVEFSVTELEVRGELISTSNGEFRLVLADGLAIYRSATFIGLPEQSGVELATQLSDDFEAAERAYLVTQATSNPTIGLFAELRKELDASRTQCDEFFETIKELREQLSQFQM